LSPTTARGREWPISVARTSEPTRHARDVVVERAGWDDQGCASSETPTEVLLLLAAAAVAVTRVQSRPVSPSVSDTHGGDGQSPDSGTRRVGSVRLRFPTLKYTQLVYGEHTVEAGPHFLHPR